MPVPAYCSLIDDAIAIKKITKIVEKFKKCAEQGDLISVMKLLSEIKGEVESYTGQKIDSDTFLEKFIKNVNSQGGNISKDQVKKIRKTIKSKGKGYQAYCFKKKDDIPEVKVPLRINIGCAVGLAGFFLKAIPHPYAQYAADVMIAWGTAMALEACVSNAEKQGLDFF